jgi:virulence-associated protein VapD
MYALSFDMVVSELTANYGEPYNKAYYEIKNLLKADGFEWIQGSTYITRSDDLSTLFRAIMHLKQIPWFVASVRDIRGYRVEEWSDFTSLVKNE